MDDVMLDNSLFYAKWLLKKQQHHASLTTCSGLTIAQIPEMNSDLI